MTTDGKALAPMETFMERVKSKLREDIGGLLPDEAVAAMVDRVIEEEFFKPKRIPAPGRGSWSTDTVEDATQFQKLVIEACRPIIERHVLALMLEKAPELDAAITKALEGGLMKFALQAMDQMFARALGKQSWQIEQVIRSAMEQKRL